jgi:alpha-D-xyloside xylohydrolase
MATPVLTDWALLPQKQQSAAICISENEASISSGKLKAVVKRRDEGEELELAFYNQKGELLLKERGPCGALKLSSRRFKPIIGGDYRLTVVFEADENEKVYGMGQYQQDFLNLKHCSLELAHRNTQARVPFMLSSKGYGFLWHNPAIGKAIFAKNATEWHAESTKQMDY